MSARSLPALLRRALTSEEGIDCRWILAGALYLITCMVLGTWLAHEAGVLR